MQFVTPLPADRPTEEAVVVLDNALLKAPTPMPTSLQNFIRATSRLYRETTREIQDRKSFVLGSKPYLTGNSGATMVDAVFKSGFPEAVREVGHLLHLGETVAPRVYAATSDGYCMERLTPAPWTPDLPLRVVDLLAERVWNRPALRPGVLWLFELEDMLHIDVPQWAMPLQYCLCHGDPAMGNVLLRGGQLIIGDPAPRAYLPECAEVDQGKILQSILGWESVAYGTPAPEWIVPAFPKRAAFWCLVSIMRIQWRERRGKERPHVLEWCDHIITGLRDELGV